MLSSFLLVVFVISVQGNVGDHCSNGDVIGVCRYLKQCPSALEDIKNRKHPQICSFINKEPVVCCIDSITSTPQLSDNDKKDECEPIPLKMTSNKTGRKAWDKCIEYQEQLVFPCKKSPILNSDMVRENWCHHAVEELIVGNSNAKHHQFPHMALLGYGNDSSSLQWLCDGALISNKFILTAAHCTLSRTFGPVTYVALNIIDSAKIDPKNLHEVNSIIRHPEYKAPRIYHDIALLELKTPITLDSFTVPACLYTGEPVGDRAISTTWNTNDVLGTNSTVLQKTTVTKYTEDGCSKSYPPYSRRGGYNESTHYCYGDREQSKYICQDDGGNLLVVKNMQIYCMYTIVGIMSLGKGCFTDTPGLYSKVDYYTPWIESIMWP